MLKLKCIKYDFGWDSAPDPAGGAYSAPPDPLAGFKRPTSKGREGEGKGWEGRGEQWRAGEGDRKEEEEGGKRKEREKGSEGIGEGERGKGNGDRPPTIFGLKVALRPGDLDL